MVASDYESAVWDMQSVPGGGGGWDKIMCAVILHDVMQSHHTDFPN